MYACVSFTFLLKSAYFLSQSRPCDRYKITICTWVSRATSQAYRGVSDDAPVCLADRHNVRFSSLTSTLQAML